jgi:peptide/nickel transport system substrate-binding protein
MPEITSRVAAPVSGGVEINTNAVPDQVETLEASDGIEVRSVPLANCHVLRFDPRHSSMSSKQPREEMNLAIDRDLLVESHCARQGVLMHSHQFPEYAGPVGGNPFNEARPYTSFDPDRTRELVAESSYSGEKIAFRTSAGYYANSAEAAQAVVHMWQDVGINVEVEITEDKAAGGPEAMQVNNWSNPSFVADPDGAFWLRGGEPTSVQRDFWTPENPRFNELGNAARETLDLDFRITAYQEMLDIWEDEVPALCAISRSKTTACARTSSGCRTRSTI